MDAVEINTPDPQQNDEGLDSTLEICRVCLHSNLIMQDLFLENDVESLSSKVMSFTNVKMVPGDGLPNKICCVCAAKLESAHEFKLQVEQADSVLREKCESLNIKAELFFNEVEVHLEAERNETINDIQITNSFETTNDTLTGASLTDKPTLLKDQFALLQVQQLGQHEHQVLHKDTDNSQEIEETNMMLATNPSQEFHNTVEDVQNTVRALGYRNNIKAEGFSSNDFEAISSIEHNYMIQQANLNAPQEQNSVSQENLAENINTSRPEETTNQLLGSTENSGKGNITLNELRNHQHSDNTTGAVDWDEENYFENLNLSSRLKKEHTTELELEKVFFMCYICDKQFVSKHSLKEHMHSHEEVRRTLSLQTSLEKEESLTTTTLSNSVTTPTKTLPTPDMNTPNSSSPQRTLSSQKMPPSGKKANKCPYCGKEYLYIISYNKHLKQHEKEKESTREDTMPLEVSFHEDESSLELDSCDNADYSNLNCEKQEDGEEEEEDNEGEILTNDNDMNSQDSELDEVIKESIIYSCNKCEEKFHARKDLRKHLITHISLQCNVCKEEFDSSESLKNHRAHHVLEGVVTKEEIENQGKDTNIEQINENKIDDGSERFKDETNDDWIEMKEFKCPDCPQTHSNKKSLAKHMETHTSTKYYCKTCNEEFVRKEHLQKHMEQHTKVKSFKCTRCNKSFNNELTLRNHLIATNHKTIIQGQVYDPNKRIKRVAAKAAQKIIDLIKTEDDMEYDDDHEDDEDDEVYTAMDKRYNRKREVVLKKTPKKDLECATCNRKCSSKQSLTKHMEQHVKDEAAEKLDKIKKEQRVSGMEMDLDKDSSDFESGLDWPIDIHECPTCQKRYSTKKSLLRHQLLHEEPNFACDICDIKFYRKDKLKAHYDKCCDKNPDRVRKCNICGDSFENNAVLKEHRAKHVTEGILTEEDLREIEPKLEDSKLGMRITRRRRTDIVGLECTECNKQYTSRKGLLRHIQVHEGKKYLCDICPKKFYRREHLKIHVAKHNMIKPYKCSRCTKRFIKEEQLTNHLSKHDKTFKKNKDPDSAKRFLCEICSKSFTQSTTLIAHLRAHNGIKPYVCEVCSRPFTTNAYLKMHMRTHTQERPYICQYCSRAFARADTLANHLTSHTGEAKYHCKYCPKNFRRLKSLKEHVFIHTGQRPYACPTCDRRFNNNGSRYAHSKRCKQNYLQNQNRNQSMTQVQVHQTSPQRTHQNITTAQVLKAQNIKTITIARPSDAVTAQQVMQHQEILMPLILPLTVTLTDVGEEVILPEGTKIFTT